MFITLQHVYHPCTSFKIWNVHEGYLSFFQHLAFPSRIPFTDFTIFFLPPIFEISMKDTVQGFLPSLSFLQHLNILWRIPFMDCIIICGQAATHSSIILITSYYSMANVHEGYPSWIFTILVLSFLQHLKFPWRIFPSRIFPILVLPSTFTISMKDTLQGFPILVLFLPSTFKIAMKTSFKDFDLSFTLSFSDPSKFQNLMKDTLQGFFTNPSLLLFRSFKISDLAKEGPCVHLW